MQSFALRVVEEIGGGALFDDRALGHEDDAVATSRAKPISCVTTTIVMPSFARSRIKSSTSPTISGSSAEVGSSKSMTSGACERAHDGDTLLLAAGEHRGILIRFVGKADALKQRHGLCVGLRLRFEAQLDGREGDVLLDRHMREEVEVLEHHAHLAAVEVQVDLLAVEGDILEVNGAGGRLLEEVQAAQQRRFAAAGRADDAAHLALADLQVNVVQGHHFSRPTR